MEEKNKVSHELTMSKLRFNLETQQFERTDTDNAKEMSSQFWTIY